MADNESSGGLKAKDLTDQRNDALREGIKGLFLMNGGGAAALLAFLQATWTQKPDLVSISVFFLFLVVALSYALIAYGLRCPSCGRRFLLESAGAKHSNARRTFGMDHWASAIVDVFRKGHCLCMYCGAKIRTR